MNYFGRLVSNVRGFYSEINSATLTGAIDVVVIRQQDGSYQGSPFHVRFGKLGVLRSREKIVDIEINGEPVPLQMKLGDAGEAFFVEEIDESPSGDICTSPPLDSGQSDGKDISELQEVVVDTTEDSTAADKTVDSQTEEAQATSTESELPTAKKSEEDQTSTEGFQEAENVEEDDDSTHVNEQQKNIVLSDDGSDTLKGTSETNLESQSNDNKDGSHSNPETGQFDESLLSSIKEPAMETQAVQLHDAPENIKDCTTETMLESNPHKSDSIPIPGRSAPDVGDALSDTESPWAESSSPVSLSTLFGREYYPLSDLDTPIGSPPTHSEEVTRLSSPHLYLSDSEVEIKQSLESIARENEIRWAWGKLPQAPEGGFLNDRKPSDIRKEDIKYLHKTKRRDGSNKPHHKVPQEGILLDDLTTVDQEVAALYLHQALDPNMQQQQSGSGSDDRESGIGQSLPCSPMEKCAQDLVESYHDIAMSLCGELRNGKVPLESFNQSMVTYEDLCNSPAILADPKLVIRINDRYYNWQIAAPMLLSHVIFQRPLRQDAYQSLVKQHMPKKEKRRSYRNMYYWFSWRANNEDKSSDEESNEPKKDKPRPRVHSGGSRKQVTATTQEVVEGEENSEDRERKISECASGNELDPFPKGNYRKVTRLSSEQLASLNLKEGANSITFSVTTKYQGTAMCTATIYLWNYSDKIVISDIDGTITKSDVLGQILPVVGQAWAQSGVAHFFCAIQKNGYKVLYLSARAIGQAQQTRDYLKSVKQDQLTLPDGPLLLSPESLIKAFHREVIEKKPEEFKIACLRDIQSLFPSNRNPFYAGFGNKVNDVLSYRAVGISVSRIFTINHRGEVRHELTNVFQSSYIKLSDLVDQMFPPFKTEGVPPSGLLASDQFSSFTYWRTPLPTIPLCEIDDDEIEIGDTTTTK